MLLLVRLWDGSLHQVRRIYGFGDYVRVIVGRESSVVSEPRTSVVITIALKVGTVPDVRRLDRLARRQEASGRVTVRSHTWTVGSIHFPGDFFPLRVSELRSC